MKLELNKKAKNYHIERLHAGICYCLKEIFLKFAERGFFECDITIKKGNDEFDFHSMLFSKHIELIGFNDIQMYQLMNSIECQFEDLKPKFTGISPNEILAHFSWKD